MRLSRSNSASDFFSPSALDRLAGRGRVRTACDDRDHMPRYTRYLFRQVQPFLKGRICEIGSGSGRFTQFLGQYEKVTAVEPQGPLHMLGMERLAYQLNVVHVQCALEDCPNDRVPAGAYDTILCINLLEHIEYDISALQIMAELASARGHVVVLASAGRSLFGRLDRSLGHVRRYNRRLLAGAFAEAGLEVTRSAYLNFAGMAAWWCLSRLKRREGIAPALADRLDRLAPAVEFVERFLRPPLGLSLLMIGRRR